MSKVRINDLARELEVKSKVILDILPEVGVTEKKTHSSSVEEDEAVRVRAALTRGPKSTSSASGKAAGTDQKPKIDLSNISRPGDVLRAIQQQKEEREARGGVSRAVSSAPRPTIASTVTAAAPAAKSAPAAAAPLPKTAGSAASAGHASVVSTTASAAAPRR